MKSYIVRKYDLNGRWDPYYNHPKFKEIYNTLTKCPFPLSTLKKESSIIFSGTTPLSGGDAYTSQDGIPFIRSGDFSENNMIDFSDVLYLKEEIHNGKMKSSQLKKGDMLIAIVGATIGKVGIYSYDREANINQAICAVRLKELDPYYAQAFFQTNIGQMLIEHIKRPVARANINLEEIGSLLIPKADLEMQQKVVSVIQIATQKKQQKEQQADSLLQSIDDYLLSELGIHLPDTKSQTIQDRMFVVNFSEVSGGRLDSKLYSNAIKQLKQSLFTSSYEKQPLNYFIKSSCNGEWGKDETEEVDESKNTKCLVIRATEFDNTYNLRLDNSRVKYRWVDNSKLSRMDILPNDLLIEKSGGSEDQPVGRVSMITEEILQSHQIAYSNFIHKITVDGINPKYLYFYLKTMHNIGITDSMQSQTNGIRNLIMKEYFDQTIIVPSLQKQQEIVDHISSISQQAKALQEEGKAILEQAKKEVEQMIIG